MSKQRKQAVQHSFDLPCYSSVKVFFLDLPAIGLLDRLISFELLLERKGDFVCMFFLSSISLIGTMLLLS